METAVLITLNSSSNRFCWIDHSSANKAKRNQALTITHRLAHVEDIRHPRPTTPVPFFFFDSICSFHYVTRFSFFNTRRRDGLCSAIHPSCSVSRPADAHKHFINVRAIGRSPASHQSSAHQVSLFNRRNALSESTRPGP